MNDSQFVDRAIQAIEALAPAKDVCWWYWCMTKSEWAAWIQAIFSVIAIAVAIIIPLVQYIFRKKSEAKDLILSAVISAWEAKNTVRTAIIRLEAFGNGYSPEGRPDVKYLVLKSFKTTIESLPLLFEDQLLRLMPIPNACALRLTEGFGIIKQLNNQLAILFDPTRHPTMDAVEAYYDIAHRDIKIAIIELKNGEEILQMFIQNHKA